MTIARPFAGRAYRGQPEGGPSGVKVGTTSHIAVEYDRTGLPKALSATDVRNLFTVMAGLAPAISRRQQIAGSSLAMTGGPAG
jgi:hypothetical protein